MTKRMTVNAADESLKAKRPGEGDGLQDKRGARRYGLPPEAFGAWSGKKKSTTALYAEVKRRRADNNREQNDDC